MTTHAFLIKRAFAHNAAHYLSRSEIARRTGLSRTTVRKWLGEAVTHHGLCNRVCQLLFRKPDLAIGFETPNEPTNIVANCALRE